MDPNTLVAIILVFAGFIIGVLTCNFYWRLRMMKMPKTENIKTFTVNTNGPEHW